MANHHRCAHGALEEYAGLWRTRHDLAFDFPSAPFGCCTDHTVTVTNRYLASTTVYAHHNDPVPQSSVGDLSSCFYKDGTCTLHDGSVVIWTPDPEEECHYVSLSKMSGWFTGTIWLSDSRGFSLSWNENSTRTVDCFKHFIVTDQGYAIQMSRRLTRSTDAEVGLVTSNQLSGSLSRALRADTRPVNFLGISFAYLPDADDATPFGPPGHHGSGYVQVRRCIPIPSPSVRFLPFNGTCFSLPMVQINLPSGFQGHAFLDPTTNIIQGKVSTIDCTDSQPFIVASGDGIRRFSPLEGSFATVSPDKITVVSSFPRIKSLPVAPQLTIFHNLILTNFTLDHEKLMDHFTRITTPRSLPFSTMIAQFSFFNIWVSLCCLVVSGSLLKTLFLLYIRIYYPGLLTRFRFQDPPLAVPPSPRPSILPVTVPTSSSRVAHPPPRSPIALDISQVEIDFSDSWPPKASTVPMSVLAVDDPVPFFVAQVPIRANGVNLLALVDTGAGITVASQSLLPLLGIFRISPSQIPAAVGMAGIPVPFVGSASVYLQIGKIALNQVIHFTEADCIPRTAEAYNVILGNDLLQRLPSWSLNYNKRVFLLDGETIPVVQSSILHRSALPEIPARRCLGACVLHSSSSIRDRNTCTLLPHRSIPNVVLSLDRSRASLRRKRFCRTYRFPSTRSSAVPQQSI
ncbi:unnamed protein product [Heligmosomoides polygyrus]|uniref:Peptidase A2 domain-containing protein n=1 Tax=Heligmosomoides polygyrus TaxID=6339 RepID=A0A183GQ80_HELPZ|nr:unnamed protein product [Heligmosomoides polygyrus]